MERYKLASKYLTNDVATTNDIMLRYVVYLLDGFTIKNIPIQVETIKGYMRCVNLLYHDHALDLPWDQASDSDAAKLLRSQKTFEGKPDRREPLHDKVLAQMKILADAGPRNGFKRAVWLWTNLGTSTGFRRQEFVMDKQEIQLYVLPNGSTVIRAFCVKNFHFFNDDGIQISTSTVLNNGRKAQQVGQEYEIQKNRQNGQIVSQSRNTRCPDLCCVETSIEIIKLAAACGADQPNDPLCVYEKNRGEIEFLTGTMITSYYRKITKLVFPSISADELKLYSVHSIRVKAAVLLHEAGKSDAYIKLRIRWLSDCFNVYLRNTKTICDQHNAARMTNDEILLNAITMAVDADIPLGELMSSEIPDEPVHTTGVHVSEYELEDED